MEESPVMEDLESLMDIVGEDPWDLPADIRPAIAALPGPGMLPLPWTTWTVIALVDYGRRKSWAHEMIGARVAPDLARRRGQPIDVGSVGARGVVAGLPEWEFDLDGGTGVLIHRPTGEPIHVDLLNGESSCSRWQFREHIAANRRPGQAVRRLVSLHPTSKAVELALDELTEADLLHSNCDGDFFLCGRLQDLAPAVEEFLRAWEDPAHRPWLAARIGDWS